MTPESSVVRDCRGAISVIEQQGLGFAVRTNTAQGMLVPHSAYHRGLQLMKEGRFQEACQQFSRGHALDTGRPGFPDELLFLTGGTVLPIEYKTETGSYQDTQLEFHPKMAALGFPVTTVRSKRDLELAANPVVGLPIPKTYGDFVDEFNRTEF